ncbi:rhomboid family intramembrane serine protease [Geitlerinema sp. PCC 7407]|uniref:rhomboid family intramembrane serine protease n=1 Tax=Geitlerinema sp. PCC 7407 TaxID=1173025 RepID=UPI00029F9E2E|nr:rhomboid family intramembrane serine protease [Geitlerinema sp. PCC 7407]AFY67783.1 Rhomboid family protein [Geitlerinema sp. PCC 7407]
MRNNNSSIQGELKSHAQILLTLVAIAWALEIADIVVFRRALDAYGIRPRTLVGLRGILFAPFLHGGLPHLISNTVPFLVLGWFVMLRETSDFFIVSVVAALISGLGTWLIGAPFSIHIGASGVVFGYLGYLLGRGYFERSFTAIFLSVITGFLYGGILWGVLPTRVGISWEGHLFGFLGGVVAAKLLSQPKSSS